MKRYRPKSFLILLLAAFIGIAVPLLAGLGSSAYFMEKMATQSTQAIFLSTGAIKESRLLLEQLVAQERQARLYDIFNEPANLEEVRLKHEAIREILQRLSMFPFADKEQERLETLQTMENRLFQIIIDGSRPEIRKEALDDYKAINNLCREIQTASHKLMVQEAENLHKETTRYQKLMLWRTFTLFVISVFLISIFVFLLIRPIRQIDKSIIRLGEGDFVTPVAVSGPQDLEFLGTKLDWLRERLGELEKDKNKFIAHISHDLKTPLASIREGAGLLSDEVTGPLSAQQKEVVKILVNNSRLLQKHIENIVNFNMAQARKAPTRKEPFPLDRLISEVTADHKPILIANHLTLQQNLIPVIIKGDREQVRIVIDNLLSNAIKHSPSSTNITISMQNTKSKAIVHIIDSGPGIPEEERSKIFKPFFQGKAAQKGRVKGTGLGLAIAKEYMENHQGTIELIIDGDNGSHFKLSLPIEESA